MTLCLFFRCVPSRSTATIKLELLPLTDGIITLDSLQISVKEKGTNIIRNMKSILLRFVRNKQMIRWWLIHTGLTYVPEKSLKINATSSISSGII